MVIVSCNARYSYYISLFGAFSEKIIDEKTFQLQNHQNPERHLLRRWSHPPNPTQYSIQHPLWLEQWQELDHIWNLNHPTQHFTFCDTTSKYRIPWFYRRDKIKIAKPYSQHTQQNYIHWFELMIKFLWQPWLKHLDQEYGLDISLFLSIGQNLLRNSQIKTIMTSWLPNKEAEVLHLGRELERDLREKWSPVWCHAWY